VPFPYNTTTHPKSRALPAIPFRRPGSHELAPAWERIITSNFPVLEVIVRFPSLSWILLWLVTAALPLPAQNNNSIPYPQNPSLQKPTPADDARTKAEREMAKRANEERQANLKRDTEKLLKLATELKEDVDKTNSNTLSIDVMKKAEEIEKLARSVKDKMKGY
jgi:hypothetical protein